MEENMGATKFLCQLFVVLIFILGGCAHAPQQDIPDVPVPEFIPQLPEKPKPIVNFSRSKTKVVVTDWRDEKPGSEGLGGMIQSYVQSALKGKSQNEPERIISIPIYDLYAYDKGDSTWLGCVSMELAIKSNIGKIIKNYSIEINDKENLNTQRNTPQDAAQAVFSLAMQIIFEKLALPENKPSAVPKWATVTEKQVTKSEETPWKAQYADKHVSITLEPVWSPRIAALPDGNRSFRLKISNTGKNAVYLSWDKTYFIENGEAKTGFMFEGVRYIERDAAKKDMLILPGTTVEKEIFPNNKVFFIKNDWMARSAGMPTGWLHGNMKGQCGAYLNLHGNNYAKNIKLTVSVD
jgi:hypothetical protein